MTSIKKDNCSIDNIDINDSIDSKCIIDNKYLKLKLIGCGSYGSVYLCKIIDNYYNFKSNKINNCISNTASNNEVNLLDNIFNEIINNKEYKHLTVNFSEEYKESILKKVLDNLYKKEYAIKIFFANIYPIFPYIEILFSQLITKSFKSCKNYKEFNCLDSKHSIYSDTNFKLFEIIDGTKALNYEELNILNNFNNNTYNCVYYISSFIPHSKFVDYFKNCSLDTVKNYIRSLLKALLLLHSKGVMHRDIKPDNFLYNIETHEYSIIDYGISDIFEYSYQNKLHSKLFYYKKENDTSSYTDNFYNIKYDEEEQEIVDNIKLTLDNSSLRNRDGTKGFLAPEVILKSDYQNDKVDIWAVGVILLSFFTKKYSPFSLNRFSNAAAVNPFINEFLPILALYSKEEVEDCFFINNRTIYYNNSLKSKEIINMTKSNIKNSENNLESVLNNKSYNAFKDIIVRDDIDNDGLDLLKMLLKLNKYERISASNALKHKWLI